MNYALVKTHKRLETDTIIAVSGSPYALMKEFDDKHKHSKKPNFDRLIDDKDCQWVNVGEGPQHDIFVQETKIKIV